MEVGVTRDFFKVKRASGGAWSCTESVLGDSVSFFRFEQRKVHRKLVNRHAGQLIGSGHRIIRIFTYPNFHRQP